MRLSKSNIGSQEIEAVTQVLRSEFLGMGPLVKKFEDSLNSFFGGEMSVSCLNTGTSALHAALLAVDIGPGDEVLVSGLTYLASFQAISATGAVPVACDVDEETGLLCLNDAMLKITKRTKALMHVHYASEMGDLDRIYEFSRHNNLRVIEDAAHSFGCSYLGKRIGSFGDIICFSFDGIKNITCAEGGAIVTSDKKVHERVRNIRLLGVEKDSDNRYEKKRSWDFDVREQGFRYHMGEMNAVIGMVQLERFQLEFKPKRIELAAYYREMLKKIDFVQMFNTAHGLNETEIVQHIMPVRIINYSRDEIRAYLNSFGIETGIHYKPSHLLSYFGGGQIKLPSLEKIYSGILTLPFQVDLTKNDIDKLIEKLKAFK